MLQTNHDRSVVEALLDGLNGQDVTVVLTSGTSLAGTLSKHEAVALTSYSQASPWVVTGTDGVAYAIAPGAIDAVGAGIASGA